MKPDRMQEIVKQAIENLGNQALVSELLTEVMNDNVDMNKQITELTTNFDSTKKDNELLKTANNKLLLDLGTQINNIKEVEKQEELQDKEVQQSQDKELLNNIIKEFGGNI